MNFKSMAAAFAIILANSCLAQTDEQSARQIQTLRAVPCRAIRLIEDPSTHVRWMLFEELNRPAAPALLMPTADTLSCRASAAVRGIRSAQVRSVFHPSPIVHAGDQLTAVQHTAIADVHLQAVALGSAAAGQTLRVRLKSNGRILSVVVDAPGNATIVAAQGEVRW